MNKITAALLAICLLISLVGCGDNSAGNDVPSSGGIESTQPPSETPEAAPEETEAPSTNPTQDPAHSEEPAKATQDPTDSEEPPEETAEPTTQPEQTAAPASSAPVSTPAPTPTHMHSYTSTVTKEAICSAEGVRAYTCSCGDSYTETIGKINDHNWLIRYEEVPNDPKYVVDTPAHDETYCTICGAIQ